MKNLYSVLDDKTHFLKTLNILLDELHLVYLMVLFTL